jgi:uncharacterized protein YbbC (DUF1343 family)
MLGGMVRTGLEALVEDGALDLRGARVGLACHPASVTRDLRHAADVVAAAPGMNLVALFGPQHGARGDKQDNMIESEDQHDPRLGLPVYSLYGTVRKPTASMLAGIDVLLFDLQDVGVRIYTFAWTMALAMQACGEAGVRCVVLDRPNPIGGDVREGPLLREGFESFVGLHPIPLRHGLTLGELARWLCASGRVRCDLEVIPCEGWERRLFHDETGLPWVMPSPNLPTLESCLPYPGTVLLEGTNLSEGRGTTRPFELVGAPWLEPHELADALASRRLPGVHFRPCWFEPTFQKHAGRTCGGVQIHVTDRWAFEPVRAAVALLAEARRLAPEDFRWRDPPYEYEVLKPPIDILWGGDGLRLAIDAGAQPEDILRDTPLELARFEESVAACLLY